MGDKVGQTKGKARRMKGKAERKIASPKAR